MKGRQLRKLFVDFYLERGHRLVPSAPLVPPDDPTILFTVAGMVQFKRLYSGEVNPLPYTRAVTVQKCLRAGGKDSDLENVGRTLRHHTFFEMLGNFSFGDYFKREAIAWGWEFATQVMKLPKERLWVSTFVDDPEAAEIWEKEQGVPRGRIIPLGAKDNFWGPAGGAGACGPCSEILFFMGSDEDLALAATQDTATLADRVDKEGDVFFEIWNMVFPQFDQQPDGTRLSLKNRGIDTGAGLERMTTALNFIETRGAIGSPYETDLLWDIVKRASEVTGLEYVRRFEPLDGRDPDLVSRVRLGLNAVADHTRALVFALSEGHMPSNEGRGYVLRRILRRALRFAHLLGVNEPFMHQLVDPVVDTLGEAWPDITRHTEHVRKVLFAEERQFLRTLFQGEVILEDLLAAAKSGGRGVLSGEDVFLLHATYGFPVDLTDEVARFAGLSIDREGYTRAMAEHKAQAKKSWKGAALGREAELLDPVFDEHGETLFLRQNEAGQPVFESDGVILALIRGDEMVSSVSEGDDASIVLDQTCFYGESGGQAGDTGLIVLNEQGKSVAFLVTDTRKTPSGLHLHKGRVASGVFSVGNSVQARIDDQRRLAVMRNHTATHLLQAALRRVVGPHIAQQGSSVAPGEFRFDFTSPEPLTRDQIEAVERDVQGAILADIPVATREMPLEEAQSLGAIAPFGEKYGHRVRVVGVEGVSMEFCGGTHCTRTGQIGSMIIIAETSIASGVRRIEARTGLGAFETMLQARRCIADMSRMLSCAAEEIPGRVERLQEDARQLRKDMQKIRQEQAARDSGGEGPALEVNGIRIVTRSTQGLDPDSLRALADTLRAGQGDCVVVIGNVDGDKVSLLCAATEGVRKRVPASKVVKEVAKIVGGGGGGRDDMAQAGGRFPEKLPEALAAVEGIVRAIMG